jgi:hypothetical protein
LPRYKLIVDVSFTCPPQQLPLSSITGTLGVVFLNFAFDALVFALAFGFVIVGQPTKVLFDGAYNLPGFAFDFIVVQHTFFSLLWLILGQTYRRPVSNPKTATNNAAPIIAQTTGKFVRPSCKAKIEDNRNCLATQVAISYSTYC